VSFIEKNKAWILPLLGVGVLGVLYMNFRPSPASPVSGPEPVAPAPQGAEVPPPVPVKPAGAAEGDLWEDLRGFAALPPVLADENGFRDQARRSAVSILPAPGPSARLSSPTGVREPQPAPSPDVKPGPVQASDANPSPELDFLIHGPAGARAWLDGLPYRSGESIPGQPLSVGPIGANSVVLKGPKGKTILSTNPLHLSGPSPRPAVEAP
jgi:hypothetical protein